MRKEPLPALSEQGKLLVTYSNVNGDSLGVEFSSTTQQVATAIIGVCATTIGGPTLVSSSFTGDTVTNTTDGGDDMETRLAVLESEVAHIKTDISELKSDTKIVLSGISDTKRDVGIILQKLVDIDSSLSKKPSSSEMTAAIASAANKQIVWTIGLAIGVLGLAKWIF